MARIILVQVVVMLQVFLLEKGMIRIFDPHAGFAGK
jgi:hypothetical protein